MNASSLLRPSRLPVPFAKGRAGLALLAAAGLLLPAAARAHGLWIESGSGGYKIFFGEPENNLREKKDKLGRFASLKSWKADGSQAKLEVREDHLFAAAGAGGFTAANLDSPVREPKAGYGMPAGGSAVKGYQYLRFAGGLETEGKPSEPLFLDILPEGKGALRFTVVKGGKPFGDARLEVLAPNGWNRTFEADKSGKAEIQAPWPGLYIVKATWKDGTPGEFLGRKYQVASHAATLSFVKP